MTQPDYERVLEAAKSELAMAKAERFKLDNRIERLQRTVMALTSLVEQPAIDPAKGITEGIKAALRQVVPNGLYPQTVRLELEKAGFDFSAQKNPMASIHAILKRLIKKGHVEPGERPDSRGAYYWMSERPRTPEEVARHKEIRMQSEQLRRLTRVKAEQLALEKEGQREK